jgi:hypothetical protein
MVPQDLYLGSFPLTDGRAGSHDHSHNASSILVNLIRFGLILRDMLACSGVYSGETAVVRRQWWWTYRWVRNAAAHWNAEPLGAT